MNMMSDWWVNYGNEFGFLFIFYIFILLYLLLFWILLEIMEIFNIMKLVVFSVKFYDKNFFDFVWEKYYVFFCEIIYYIFLLCLEIVFLV